jgi:hypothetical protein
MPFTPAGAGQVLMGRLRLPQITGTVSESLGDPLDASVGGGLTKMGRSYPLAVGVYGMQADLPDPFTVGNRLRRQLRSLMENTMLKAGSIYVVVSVDTEISGWYLIGGVDLAYGDGGVTFADYTIALGDALRIGGVATHRHGRRFIVLDRRLPSSPLDYRCLVYNTAYTAYPGNPIVWLPYNISDVRNTTRQVPSPGPTGTFTSIDADVGKSMQSLQPIDTQVVSFEQADVDVYTGQVVAYDRRGLTAPTLTAAGDIDPQNPTTGYGWEEVYGSIYPYSAGDAPVIANGICRCRWLGSPGALVVEWNKNTRNVAYTEMARVLFYEELSGSTRALTTLVSAAIAEYSEERVVMRLVVSGSGSLQDVYVTLQRGWSGPRIEQYTTVTSEGATLGLIPFNSGATTLSYRHNGTTTTIATTATLLDYTDSTHGDEPWVNLSPVNTTASMVASFTESGMVAAAFADTVAYGATRNGVKLTSPYNAAAGPIPVPFWNAAKLDFYASGTITLATAQAAAGNSMFDARSVRTVVSRVP